MTTPAWITEMIVVQNEIEKKLANLNLLVRAEKNDQLPELNNLTVFVETIGGNLEQAAAFESKYFMKNSDNLIGTITITSLHGHTDTISLFESDYGFNWQTPNGHGVEQFMKGFIDSLPQLYAIFG